MATINPTHVAEYLCKSLSIRNNQLAFDIFKSTEDTDFDDKNSIKKLAKQIKLMLKDTHYACSHSRLLNLIAESLGYPNSKDMLYSIPEKIQIPSYVEKILSENYRNQEVDKEALSTLFTIVKDKGLNGLLPKNLPDDLLMNCSIQYQAYREKNPNLTISLLFIASLLLYSGENFLKNHEKYQLKIHEEELYDAIEAYGINILLEEMDRINVIDIHPHYKPNVRNFFDTDRTINMKILDPKAFESYSN